MRNLISIRSVPEDNNYLLLNVKVDVGTFLVTDMEIEIYKELQMLYFKLFEYERTHYNYVSDCIAIKKDSFIGQCLLSHPEMAKNEDEIITYDKVVSAFNIAVFENDEEMSNKILPYFRERVSGQKQELISPLNQDVIEYILENSDFNQYLADIDSNVENKEYIVYENEKYEKKILGKKKSARQKK